MGKLVMYLSVLVLLIAASSVVMAKSIDDDCQQYFGSDFHGIAKFEASGTDTFTLADHMADYSISGYNLAISGDRYVATWTSDVPIDGVLVKASTNTEMFSGGMSGEVYGWDTVNPKGKPVTHEISHILFCGDSSVVPPCTGPTCNPNGVPEFSYLTLGFAVVLVGLGLAYLRKN